MSRILTALALMIIALYLVFWANAYVFLAAALLMSLLCYREFSGLVANHGIGKPDLLGLLAGGAILLWPTYALISVALALLLMFAFSLRQNDLRSILPNVACSLLAAFYTFAPWHYAVELRKLSVHLLFMALALNWAGDSVAYYVGSILGRHRLAPNVSPKKSWEGAIASVVGSVIVSLLYLAYVIPGINLWKVALIAALSNVAGQFGDLAESAIKRGAGVKDSGTLLPGHGGMLDRVDSSLFAVPVAFFLITLLHLE